MTTKKRKDTGIGEHITKQEEETRRVVTLANGKRYRVIREDGKYYYFEGLQLRKSNPNIVSVKEG